MDLGSQAWPLFRTQAVTAISAGPEGKSDAGVVQVYVFGGSLHRLDTLKQDESLIVRVGGGVIAQTYVIAGNFGHYALIGAAEHGPDPDGLAPVAAKQVFDVL